MRGWRLSAEASDGVEAVQRCGELKPDLVVLDVGLPKLNGLEAGRQIREVSPDTKVLFLSANCGKEVVRGGASNGRGGVHFEKNAGRELLVAVRSAVKDEEFLRFTVFAWCGDRASRGVAGCRWSGLLFRMNLYLTGM